MRRRISLFVAFIGVVGLLGLNPAQATHDGGGKDPKKDNGKHEGMPTPPDPDLGNLVAECVVLGEVSIGNSQSQNGTGGVSATSKNHNHYRFQDTVITCRSATNDAFNDVFNVDAAGGTDGPAAVSPSSVAHGEDTTLGWSHSDCYTGRCTSWWGNKKLTFTDIYTGTNVNPAGSTQCTNCGEISIANPVTGAQSRSTLNWVKFVRELNQVEAWGVLVATAGATGTFCFVTHLDFTPENDVPPKAKVDSALLAGTATVWDAKNSKASCTGGKGQKR